MTDAVLPALAESPAAPVPASLKARTRRRRALAYVQAAPMAFVFAAFFLVPLLLTLMVSFWE